MVEQAIDLVKMRAYECAKIIINNRNVDGLAKLIIKHEEFKAQNQTLLEALKRSQQQRDEIFADLVKAQEVLKDCLTLIDNNGLSPRGNLRKKVAEAIQGEEDGNY